MAAPKKTGLDYFPFDVDFFEDEKIEAISGEFGPKGELATVKLLCAVYNNGYFAVWNNLFKMKLLKRLPGTSLELLEQIVNRLVLWGFFEKSLFDSDMVLTSKDIQDRYFTATKRRALTDDLVYVLNNGVNVYRNPTSNSVNVNKNSQSKGKEIKVNEIKEEEESPASPAEIPDYIKAEQNAFVEDLKNNPPELRGSPLNLDDLLFEIRGNRQFLEVACMTRKTTEQEFNIALTEFFAEKKVLGHKAKSLQDVMQHFLNWLAIWKQKRDKEATTNGSKGKIQQGVEVSASAADRIRQQRANQ